MSRKEVRKISVSFSGDALLNSLERFEHAIATELGIDIKETVPLTYVWERYKNDGMPLPSDPDEVRVIIEKVLLGLGLKRHVLSMRIQHT